jgi:hypothetical protein
VPLSGGKVSYGSILLRGLLAGLIAGLLSGLFAYSLGEPKVDAAIALEEAHSHGEPGEEPLVSRDGQKGGLILATALYGIAMGGLLATGYTLLRRRLRTADDARASLALAGAAFVGLVLVPWVKYPPNPPAVGNPATIDQRTISYLAILVIGLVAVWAGVVAARSLRAGAPEWLRLLAGLAGFLVVVVVGYALLPNVDEVGAGFPASLLWNFRLTSLGTQVTLWVSLAFAFTALLSRLASRTAARPDVKESVAA